MLPPPCYVISDVHLGHASDEIERSLVAFLRSLPGTAESLMINGDLFEFWFEWRTVVPRYSIRVLSALMELHDVGFPVVMVAGNHDSWGGEVLRSAGVEFHSGPWQGSLGGWAARVEHGDGLRAEEDRGYRLLKRFVLRNTLAIRAFKMVHPDLASRLAMGSSHASRTYQSRDGGEGLRSVAERALSAEPGTELLIYGHSHVATLERMPTGNVFANAGSWLDAPTFLAVTPERISLRRWEGAGSPSGTEVRALDRVSGGLATL